MRIVRSISIDLGLWERATQVARNRGTTLSGLVTQSLEKEIGNREEQLASPRPAPKPGTKR